MRHPGVVRGSRAALTVLWVTLALVVVATGWIGVHVVANGLTPTATPVLSDAEMDALLASAEPAATPSSPRTGPTEPKPSASSEPAGDERVVVRTFRSLGGAAVVACAGSTIDLRGGSPLPGYSVDQEVGESELELRFESGDNESRIKVRCESGVPVGEVDDD